MRKRTYLDPKFSAGDSNSDAYRDNWDRIFGEKTEEKPEETREQCTQCGSEILGHHACEGVPGGFGED